MSSEVVSNCEMIEVKAYKGHEISSVIADLLAPSVELPIANTLKKYLSAGEYFYQKASDLDSKIKCFENCIRRPYFHVKLLDDVQLENWHHYLDFVEMQGDFDWVWIVLCYLDEFILFSLLMSENLSPSIARL